MKKKKKLKPVYLRVRLPMIRQTGGVHTPDKGGRYRRNAEKGKVRKEIRDEAS